MRFFELADGTRINVAKIRGLLPPGWRNQHFVNQARYIRAFWKSRHVLGSYGINTPRRLGHFLAQGLVETGYLRQTEENTNYSLKRYRELPWLQRRFEYDEQLFVDHYLGHPERIANRIYGARYKPGLGNGDEASGDGWRYRGRGFFQLTGRANYTTYDAIVPQYDLVNNPDLLGNDIEAAIEVAAAFFADRDLHQYADVNDADAISRAVNLGSATNAGQVNHLSERIEYASKCVAFFGDVSPYIDSPLDPHRPIYEGEKSEDVYEIQSDLIELGYLDGPADGDFGPGTLRALKAFQRDQGLQEDGVVTLQVRRLLDDLTSANASTALSQQRSEAPDRALQAESGMNQVNDGRRLSQTGGVVAAGAAAAASTELLAGDEGQAEQTSTAALDPSDSSLPSEAETSQVADPSEPAADLDTAAVFEAAPWVNETIDRINPQQNDHLVLFILLGVLLLGLFIMMRGRRVERESRQAARDGRI